MRTAVVILTFNGRHWLERFLPGVLRHSTGAEVVVADNGSADGTVDWLHANAPAARVIAIAHNQGFAGGYNTALAQVDADRYVLLNSDVEVAPDWLAGMHALMDREPGLVACQPKVLSHADPSRFEHAGAAGGFLDRNGYPFCRGRIFELTEEDRGQYDDERDVFWATGACLMVDARAFHTVGGFEAALFAHMEEIDLCWRFRRRGWRVGYTHRSVVRHVGGGSLAYGSPRKTYLNFRNSLLVLVRNMHQGWLPIHLLRRAVLDLAACLKFLAEGHAAHAGQVLRAYAAFLRRLPNALRQRRALRAFDDHPDLAGLYTRSIAFDRFLLGQRRFSELDPAAFVQRSTR